MNDETVLMHGQELGDLYLYDVLLSYIYPRVFICEDSVKDKYIFYEVSSKDNKDVWLVSKISEEDCCSLAEGKKVIQTAYADRTDLFSVTKTYGQSKDTIEISTDVSEWVKKLPEKPVYADS